MKRLVLLLVLLSGSQCFGQAPAPVPVPDPVSDGVETVVHGPSVPIPPVPVPDPVAESGIAACPPGPCEKLRGEIDALYCLKRELQCEMNELVRGLPEIRSREKRVLGLPQLKRKMKVIDDLIRRKTRKYESECCGEYVAECVG